MSDAPRYLRRWSFHDDCPANGYTVREALPDWLFQPLVDQDDASPTRPPTAAELTGLYDAGKCLNSQLDYFIRTHDEHCVPSRRKAEEVLRDISIAMTFTSRLLESIEAQKSGVGGQMPRTADEYTSIHALITEQIPGMVAGYQIWWGQQKVLRRHLLLEQMERLDKMKRAHEQRQADESRQIEEKRRLDRHNRADPYHTIHIQRSGKSDREPTRAELDVLHDVCYDRIRQAKWLACRLCSLSPEFGQGLVQLIIWISEHRENVQARVEGRNTGPRDTSEYDNICYPMARVGRVLEQFERRFFAPPVWCPGREEEQALTKE